MPNFFNADDFAEREDLQRLQAERWALNSRAGAIGATPWDTSFQMKTYVDEMDALIRRYTSDYAVKAQLWQYKGRYAVGHALGQLLQAAQYYRNSYYGTYLNKQTYESTMGVHPFWPQPSFFPPPLPPNDRMRAFFDKRCISCGNPLPSLPVDICPRCRGKASF